MYHSILLDGGVTGYSSSNQVSGDAIAVVSPQLGECGDDEVDGSLSYGAANGASWSCDGPLFAFEGFRIGRGAGARGGEVHPPFVRSFALGDGDGVRVRADGRAEFREHLVFDAELLHEVDFADARSGSLAARVVPVANGVVTQ